MFKKKTTYNMDIATAGKTLENVFAACDTAPNKISFDKIVLQNRQNLFSDNLFIILSAVIFVLSFFAPLCFPHSSIFMSADAGHERPLSVYDHVMTESTFSISFEGSTLDMSKCYMEGADDSVIYAIKYDRSTNTVVFPYVPMEYNIYIFDVNGKYIHLLLSPKN